MSSPSSTLLEKGLPSNLDAERFVLGAILMDDSYYVQAAGVLDPDDFSVEKHRRIFLRMGEIQNSNERIDRVTVANELMKHKQLESVDGLSYLVSLDDGLPQSFNIESYIRIVKDKSILRKMIFASQEVMNRCLSAEDEPSQILAAAEEQLLRLGDQQVKAGLASAKDIVNGFEGGINAFLDPSRRVKGTSTGFTKFDEMTSGMHGGELLILAARPSMGKTALALNIATHIGLRMGTPVAVFSLEMSRESVLTRMLCATSRVDSNKFRQGYLNSDEKRRLNSALVDLTEAPIFIDDTPGLNLMDMHAKLRRLESQVGKLGAVIVDYLQLMSSRGRVENRNQEVAAISRGLKLLAKELDTPMLVLSQLSRATVQRQGDFRPMLSDLRDSGAIEQDADVVAFVHREEYYRREDASLRGLAELIVAKQRNGPIGKIEMVFLHEMTKFENRLEDLGDEPPPDYVQ